VKYAFINIQRIAAESAEGKCPAAHRGAAPKKAAELRTRTRPSRPCSQQRSAVWRGGMAQVQKDIDDPGRDSAHDAGRPGRVQNQNELQLDFQRKVGLHRIRGA
jgi:hypothetical protein